MSGQPAAMFPNFGTTSILVKNPVQSNMHGEQAMLVPKAPCISTDSSVAQTVAPIQRTNISKLACTPPKYDGKTELAFFLQRFDTVCVLNGWADDMVKKLWLSCSLDGEAVRLLDLEDSS